MRQGEARGDQCDAACGTVLEAESLEPICAVCGSEISFRQQASDFVPWAVWNELKNLVERKPLKTGGKNAQTFSERYIRKGAERQGMTRDLDWGIEVPHAGYENKKIYIWVKMSWDNLSSSKPP